MSVTPFNSRLFIPEFCGSFLSALKIIRKRDFSVLCFIILICIERMYLIGDLISIYFLLCQDFTFSNFKINLYWKIQIWCLWKFVKKLSLEILNFFRKYLCQCFKTVSLIFLKTASCNRRKWKEGGGISCRHPPLNLNHVLQFRCC